MNVLVVEEWRKVMEMIWWKWMQKRTFVEPAGMQMRGKYMEHLFLWALSELSVDTKNKKKM